MCSLVFFRRQLLRHNVVYREKSEYKMTRIGAHSENSTGRHSDNETVTHDNTLPGTVPSATGDHLGNIRKLSRGVAKPSFDLRPSDSGTQIIIGLSTGGRFMLIQLIHLLWEIVHWFVGDVFEWKFYSARVDVCMIKYLSRNPWQSVGYKGGGRGE